MLCPVLITTPPFAAQSSGGGSLSDAVILAPSSTTRNRVQPTGDYPGLILRGFTSQTAKLFRIEKNTGALVTEIGIDGQQQWNLYETGTGTLKGSVILSTPGGFPGLYWTDSAGMAGNGYFILFNTLTQQFELCHLNESLTRIVVGKDGGTWLGLVTFYCNNTTGGVVVRYPSSPTKSALRIEASSGAVVLDVSSEFNVGIGSTDYGGGGRVIALAEATIVPTGTPTTGAIIWLESDGLIRYRNSLGETRELTVPRLNLIPAPMADVDMNGQRLVNLGAPSSVTDSATKGYVDTAVSGAATVAGDGLVQAGTTISLNPDDVTIAIVSNAATVKTGGITDTHVATANKDGIAATPSMRTLGTGAQQAAAGNHGHTSLTLERVKTTGAAPSAAAASAAGPGATAVAAGTDMAGVITLTTGTTTALGDLLTVTFATTYGSVPTAILLTPANAIASEMQGVDGTNTPRGVYVNQSTVGTASFTIRTTNTPLVSSTVYKWFFLVIE